MRIGELLSTLIPPTLLAGCGGPNASNAAGSAQGDSARETASPSSADVTDVLDISPEGDAQATQAEEADEDSAETSGKASVGSAGGSEETEATGEASGQSSEEEGTKKPSEDENEKAGGRATSADELTEDERRVLQDLKTADRAVRAHEQAHLAAAGPYANGGASFQYRTGPDGRHYAVAGEVSIDASPESDPEATIRKAQVVRAAALAPADPSAQDRNVAAQATKMEAQAMAELRQTAMGGSPASGETASGESGPIPNVAGLARSFLASPGFTRLGTRFDAVA